MCLQRYGLDTKRNFWRRYDDVYPKVQIHFHFNSKSAIKNALELVLGPFTSNPQQVKKNVFGSTGKFQDPPLEISRTRPVILCPLKNSRTPPWKFQDPTSHKVLDISEIRCRKVPSEKCTDVPVEKCQQVPEQKCAQVGIILFIRSAFHCDSVQVTVQKCWDEPKEHCTEKTVGFFISRIFH